MRKLVSVIAVLLIALTLPRTALGGPATQEAPPNKLQLCDTALGYCEERVKLLEQKAADEQRLRELVTKQRDAAYEKIEEPSSTPWYLWVLIGAAAGVTARGLVGQ